MVVLALASSRLVSKRPSYGHLKIFGEIGFTGAGLVWPKNSVDPGYNNRSRVSSGLGSGGLVCVCNRVGSGFGSQVCPLVV